MISHPLNDLLTERLQQRRRNAPPLNLGILVLDAHDFLLETIWQDLDALHFKPRLYLIDKYRSAVLSQLQDDNQFDVVAELASETDVLRRAHQDAIDGEVDLLLQPQRTDPEVTRALLGSNSTAMGFSLFFPQQLERPLMITDVATEPAGDAEHLSAAARAGALLLNCAGIEMPRVAMLTAVETVNEGLPATVIARAAEGIPAADTGLKAQGPLSLDLAISPYACEKKGVEGPVAGHADLLVAPNLTVALGVTHALTCLCEEPSATVVTGGPVPIAIPLECAGHGGIILSTLLAAIVDRRG